MFLAGEAGPEKVNIDPMNQNPGWQDMRSIEAQPAAPSSGLNTGYLNTAGSTPEPGSMSTAPAQGSQALDFLNQAYQSWLARSPWSKRGVPTPVALSSPGTNPYLQQYASAGAALRYGIDPTLYLNEAAQAAPIGLSGAPGRRTR